MSKTPKTLRVLRVVAILSVVAGGATAAPQYRLTDLGTLGGTVSSAAALNSSGQVVGFAAIASGRYRAFIYSGGVMTDLGTLGGTDSHASAINDAGEVTGQADTAGVDEHAFLYSHGALTDLGTLGGHYSSGVGINNNGQIVGRSYTSAPYDHAFIYSHGVMEELPFGNGNGAGASAINDRGQIIGYYDRETNESGRALLFSDGVVTELTAPGWLTSAAASINQRGEIIGSAEVSYDGSGYITSRAVFFSEGTPHTLGTLGGRSSHGSGINDAGQIVGTADTVLTGGPYGLAIVHGFLYTDGQMFDLNDLLPPGTGWVVSSANAINQTGQIAANALAPNGETHAVLLTPDLSMSAPMTNAIANMSTRGRVGAGDDVVIGGLIISGAQGKKVILRGRSYTIGVITNLVPTLELHDAFGHVLATNQRWGESANYQEIVDSGLAPPSSGESAILRTLSPGNYTVILRGGGGSEGIGLVEIFDLDRAAPSRLANLSTRGRVGTGDDVLISGVIVTGTASQRVIIRATGPSLTQAGIADPLADPTMELHDANGLLLVANDDWQSDQESEIRETQLRPSDPAESAIVRTLLPGNYTAVVRGAHDSVGVALVEVYGLDR